MLAKRHRHERAHAVVDILDPLFLQHPVAGIGIGFITQVIDYLLDVEWKQRSAAVRANVLRGVVKPSVDDGTCFSRGLAEAGNALAELKKTSGFSQRSGDSKWRKIRTAEIVLKRRRGLR